MKKITLLLLAILTSQFAYLQKNGFITGKVVDEKTGEDLIGVSVTIKGNKTGTATDIDGTFKLEAAPGIYDVQFSYISYGTKTIEKVEVVAGQLTEPIHVTLAESANILNGYEKKETATRGTSSALIIEQKGSPVMFDGISADQMRRTPDRNTADVLRRISGATIQDNFVIIRGLPDRYNAAFLNGSPLPSSEPDRKAFSFDIFPSALLSDLRVIKTAMPSLSGEFAGGLIQVRTKEIPEKTFYSFSLGATFDFMTTFSSFKSSQGGGTDFFGIDDGSRSLSNGFPTTNQLVDAQNKFKKDTLVLFAKMMNNNFGINNRIAGPGANFQFNMGHNINLVPKAKRATATYKAEFGSSFAVTYSNRTTFRTIERNDYDGSSKTLHFDDQQYNNNTSWGALWNLAFIHSQKNGANNKVSLKNIFNINSNDQFILRTGQDLLNGFDTKSYNMFYTQNMLFATQLNGEHVLPKSKIKFEWSAGYSRLSRSVPDYKIVEYRRNLGDTAAAYSVPFSTQVQLDKAGRFFSNQLDNTFSGSFDFSLPFKIGPTRHELKMGTFLMDREREFSARQVGYVRYKSSGADISSISMMGIDTIFMDRNMGVEGLMIKEITRNSDSYNSSQKLIAGYVQLENAFFENKLKFIWGVRLESFRQQLKTYDYATGAPINIDTNVVDVLPSLNVIYGFNEKMNLRFSASQTVCRPESRELAPFTFYDYALFAFASGNPNLRRTKITNVDLRYEWYPAGGQMISVTGFFKYFENPIEKILYPAGSIRLFSYANVPSAYSFGAELEYRFTIGSFIKNKHSRVLDDLSFSGNFAYIHSEVNLDSVAGVNQRRALQGQSPYIVNMGFSYNDSKYDFGVSLFMNYIGPRIFSVGNVSYGSILENPRFIMDLQITKSFLKKKLDLRLNFSDLLAQTAYYFQDTNGNGTYDDGVDNKMIARKASQQVTFSIGYKF
jgi:TonB-dependent receptor